MYAVNSTPRRVSGRDGLPAQRRPAQPAPAKQSMQLLTRFKGTCTAEGTLIAARAAITHKKKHWAAGAAAPRTPRPGKAKYATADTLRRHLHCGRHIDCGLRCQYAKKNIGLLVQRRPAPPRPGKAKCAIFDRLRSSVSIRVYLLPPYVAVFASPKISRRQAWR